MNLRRTAGLAALTIISAGAMMGCAASVPERPFDEVVSSGFVTDYARLKRDRDRSGQLVYRSPKTDYSVYDKVMFERVQLWRARDVGFGDITDRELQRLADGLYLAARAQLPSDRTVVKEADATTLRIHLALTDITEAETDLEVFASSPPSTEQGTDQGDRIELGPEALAFAAKALIELEIDNAETGEVLITSVDQNLSRVAADSSLASGDDIKRAFESWAKSIPRLLANSRTARPRR